MTTAPPSDPADVLAGLDDEQRAAASAIHGPVVVLAGAGTGKTRAITHRIAYAAATGAHDPRRTLAVTFTTRAAGEMRLRLRALGADGVQVRTFHSAALRQLRHFWPRLSAGAFPELLPAKARLVAEAASRCGLPTDKATVRDLSADLEWAKVNFLSGSAIGKRAESTGRELAVDSAEVARVLAAYEDAKEERNLLDFEDVLLVTAHALAKPEIAEEVQAAYRWFTVDEYQDVNPLQQRLLDLWLGDRDDVCVVGDPSQTIYTFTGATPEYLSGFRSRYPDATEVRLVRCYRCTPQIVSLANGVIAGSTPARNGQRPLMLQSQRSAGEEGPSVDRCADDVDEAVRAAGRVQKHLAAGVAARDIAVLFRINAQSAALEEAFAQAGIPVVLRGTERFFNRPEVREAVTRLRGAARSGGPAAALGDEVRAVLGAMGWSAQPPTTVGAVRERWESLSAIVTLADERADIDDLSAFVAELDARADAQHAPVADGVTLSSIHSAKGLEWRVVIVVGCSDGLLPFRQSQTGDEIEEERRLAYVAFTRAKDTLHLSWAEARAPGGRATRTISPYLATLGESFRSTDAGSVHRGSNRPRGERKRSGPRKCRVCRKALVTPPERTLGRCQSCPSSLNEELLDRLREWRLAQAREQAVPAYVVFTDVTLIAMAEQLPANSDGLLEIPGVGPKKLATYGDDVLALIREFA